MWEWIDKLNSSDLSLYFSLLTRQLTVSFRGLYIEENISDEQKLEGLYFINDIQHRILMRLLPGGTVSCEDAQVIVSQIKHLTNKNYVFASHMQSALVYCRDKLNEEK